MYIFFCVLLTDVLMVAIKDIYQNPQELYTNRITNFEDSNIYTSLPGPI